MKAATVLILIILACQLAMAEETLRHENPRAPLPPEISNIGLNKKIAFRECKVLNDLIWKSKNERLQKYVATTDCGRQTENQYYDHYDGPKCDTVCSQEKICLQHCEDVLSFYHDSIVGMVGVIRREVAQEVKKELVKEKTHCDDYVNDSTIQPDKKAIHSAKEIKKILNNLDK